MHREISHTDSALAEESSLPLYLMTGLLAVLMALHITPRFGEWAGWAFLQAWPKDPFGYRDGYAMLAAILGGARVVHSALQGLFEGKIGADVAIAVAFLAAILIAEWLVAAEVIFIGMFGECLEAFTFDRTKRAIRQIVEVFPIRCWRLRDGQEERVFTRDLQVGDRIVVKPGGKIPVDGVVVDGRSAVNTAALNGESVPIDKGPGDEVLAGSVNDTGALVIDATRVAQQTVAGRVIELTARALKDKSNIERTADRLARLFLPIVLALAVLTFAVCFVYFGTPWFRPANATRLGGWQALTLSVYPTLSVLVVACPCALILATPAAVIAALGRLAGTGVLIKSGSALERLAAVGAFAFDKTGTITEGKLELGDVVCLTDIRADELVRLAASAEQRSEHPIARLIVQEASRRALTLDELQEFQAHPGAGVAARIGASKSSRVLVGTRRLLEEQGIALTEHAQAALTGLDAGGQTSLLVARDGVLLGILGARDQVRLGVVKLVNELRDLGITPIVLLTGDRAAAARAADSEGVFSAIHAELLPQQKAQFIADMKAPAQAPRAQGEARRGVAMVGDGINDAPALACADVGIAVGSGADIAAEAGDIVLMGDPLKPLPLLVRLSRETVKIIRQNIIGFAFIVNAIGIVFTAWLWPILTPPDWYEQSPLAAVLYHQLGSMLVLLNSMRLLWFERTSTSPTMIAWKDRLEQFDRWLTGFDWHEAQHWCERRWRRLLGSAALLLVLCYAASGWTIVAPDEVGVVRRFGRPIADLEPGWYWRYPAPIEDTLRVSQQVRTINIGFRESRAPLSAGKGTGGEGTLTWSSAHRKETRVAAEAMMMTGDGNLVDLLVTVRYKATSPRVYLFEVSNVEDIIRAAAESELRTMVAGRKFAALLTVQREQFHAEVLKRVEARCIVLASSGLGIELDGIAVIDLHPPGEVVESYYDVAKAMERKDKRKNDALQEKTRLSKEADAEVNKILAQARAAAEEKVQEAWQDQLRFDARYSPYVRHSDLSKFRLYWDAVGRSLTGRELILIDAEKVQLRRNLMLFDPEPLRVPVPFLPQQRFAPKEPAPKDHGP